MEHLVIGDHAAIAERCPKCEKRFDPEPALNKKFVKIEWRLSTAPKDLPERELHRLATLERAEKRQVLDESEASYRRMPALVRLFTHMEKSETCSVKSSQKYGHFIHIMSGGFLRLTSDDEGRSCLVEADEPDPEPPATPYETPYGEDF